jgi:hypothetical protein
MRRFLLIALVLLSLAPARAEAVTVRDIIELSRAGLGDDVLLALIEVDRTVFAIDTQTITRLKQAGVSERVISAMIRSGRTRDIEREMQDQPPVFVEPPPPSPPVVVIDHHETVREVPVPVAVPVYVPVVQRRIHHEVSDPPSITSNEAGTDRRHDREEPKAQPVYWGWGGQLRPDAWKPK